MSDLSDLSISSMDLSRQTGADALASLVSHEWSELTNIPPVLQRLRALGPRPRQSIHGKLCSLRIVQEAACCCQGRALECRRCRQPSPTVMGPWPLSKLKTALALPPHPCSNLESELQVCAHWLHAVTQLPASCHWLQLFDLGDQFFIFLCKAVPFTLETSTLFASGGGGEGESAFNLKYLNLLGYKYRCYLSIL